MALRVRAGLMLIGFAAPISIGAVPAAQTTQPATRPASEDGLLLMSRAVEHYNLARESTNPAEIRAEYESSIRELNAFLQAARRDPSALLLRALAHGQLALLHEGNAREQRRAGQAEQAVAEQRLAAQRYDEMARDLDELVKAPPREEYAIAQLLQGVDRLLNAVVQAKLARYEERRGAMAPPERKQAEVQRRAEFLRSARDSLQAYLNPAPDSGRKKPTGLNRVRGEYFLGVVLYRLALTPGATPEEPDRTTDPVALEQARKQLLTLTDPQSPSFVGALLPKDMRDREDNVNRWLSYPNVYLGLIRMRQGNLDARQGALEAARSKYEEARAFLQQAQSLDQYRGGSLTEGAIAEIVTPNLTVIEQAVQALERRPERAPMEDLRIEWFNALAWDTNVILLGHHTDPPPGIDGRRDILYGTGVALTYTLDLAKIDPKLDRWRIGLLGRTSANWHGRIDEYNEDDYGGSAAIEYELVRKSPDGHQHGPLIAGIQYDYDQFNLGNDGFVRINRVTPRITLNTFDERSATTFAFRYEDRAYSEPLIDWRFNRSGNYFAFNVTEDLRAKDMTEVYGEKAWGLANDPADRSDPDFQRWLQPYLGFEYGWDSTRGNQYDCNRFLTAAGITVPLPYGVDFDFGAQWEWQDYHGHDLVDYHRKSRDDFIQHYGFALQRRFVLVPGEVTNRYTLKIDRVVLILRGDVRFTIDDSNVEDRLGQEIYSYDRAIYGLSAILQFD